MVFESSISNIGTATKRCKLPAAVMTQIAESLGEDYPAESSTYRLGNDLVMLFPKKKLPEVFAACDWGLVTVNNTNEPLALFPDISPSVAYDLRRYLCCTAKAPIVFYHCPSDTVYLSYMNHDWTIGAWFTLGADDFIHVDSF